jgi:predicted lipoprotein with Yx(FWY)xxD motif
MRLGRAVAPLLLAALVAACSGAASTGSPSAAPATAAASGGAGGGYGGYGGGGAAASASPAAASGGMALAQTSLGRILVGPSGMTLYMFMPDTSTSSACTGACASTWPPLAGSLPSLGTGLAASDFGSLARSDGTTQVTFHGHPLYYFSGDKAAGDTNGQGLSGKWYVLGADGNAIK